MSTQSGNPDVRVRRFSASDGKEGVATAHVSINLCNCSTHGTCLFDLLDDRYQLKDKFRIVMCDCSIGWEGIIRLLNIPFVRNTMEDNWVVKCLFVINWMYQNIHVVHCSMSCLMRLQCIDLFNVQL